MDLFDSHLQSKNHAPLADRMRPTTIDEIVGQDHILGQGKVLRTLIEKDQLRSIIFWGQPGTGKTTIASVIARSTGADFVALSAVNTGVKEARVVIEKAKDSLKFHHKRTILFIDEIHRFSKSQQDAFLPAVEDGTIILIGATTENPSFEVNSALLSRSRVFVLNALNDEALSHILDRGLNMVSEMESGADPISLDETARRALIDASNGDARTLLNMLEYALLLIGDKKVIGLPVVQEAIQQSMLRYDKNGEEHYNVISAFIKSMRNSDANAALYWMARMIMAGEDPLFIARRMVVFASEDVGLADPKAIMVATSVFQAVHAIGMPEARIPLAHCAVYLSKAPRNNSAYMGIEAALSDAKEHGNLPVPLHLRNAPTKLMKDLDYGKGYQYAHDFKEKIADMQCMPDELKDRRYLF
ncbi:replication-associated recombination protein A [Candidatus Uhrbacteria bacterium]|nr:replication-associated recombination protein A [Candidatus Uhrbacteria bacterium]